MTATASLEDYIRQFKQDYKKYLSSDTSSIASSIDTEELLSDMSSDTSSMISRPKSSIKSISSLKKRNKKTKVTAPLHMKPLHSTPLKMIQEEDEFAESKYKLNEYLPQSFDIHEYLPRARAAKNQKVNEILASLDTESENMSVLSSVDTEALLQSSDEDEPVHLKIKTPDFKNRPKIEKESFKENLSKNTSSSFGTTSVLRNQSKNTSLSIGTISMLSLVPKRLTTESSSIAVSKPKSKLFKPSEVFNSFKLTLKPLKVCTCILSGSIFTHFKTCRPVVIQTDYSQKPIDVEKKKGLIESVVLIQRWLKKCLKIKKVKTLKPSLFLPTNSAAKIFNSAYKELEVLKSLASSKSSDINLSENNWEFSSVDTESLLNSSISSVLSRKF